MTFKPLAMLVMFKNGKITAMEDITRYTDKDLKLLLEIQADLGRTWEYEITPLTEEGER